MSGKRAWPPPRSRRPSTAAETSGWPPSCRPGLGRDLPAGAAPVPRRLHGGECRRSTKEIRTEWLAVSRNGAAPTSGRPGGSSVPDTMSTRLPAVRWQRAKTPDATPEPDLCPTCRAPFLYAQATAVRTAVLMSRKDLYLGWALSRPPTLRGQGGPGVGQVLAAPRCPLEGRLGMPTEQALNGRSGLLGRP